MQNPTLNMSFTDKISHFDHLSAVVSIFRDVAIGYSKVTKY